MSVGALAFTTVPANAASLEELEAEIKLLREDYAQLSVLSERKSNEIEFSGFISVRAGKTSSKQRYASSLATVNSVSHDWEFRDGTVVGMQTSYAINDKFSSQVQLIAKGSLDFDVNMELGFIEYKASESLSVRAGRLRFPTYSLSEYLDIGYAYPWAGAPREVYGIFPYSAYEGVDLRYWVSSGDWDFKINPFLAYVDGRKSLTAPTGTMTGIDLRMSYEAFSFKLGYTGGRLKFENGSFEAAVDTLINGYVLLEGIESPDGNVLSPEIGRPGLLDLLEMAAVAAEAAAGIESASGNLALAAAYAEEAAGLRAQYPAYPTVQQNEGKRNAEFYAAGATYDDGEWLIMAEISTAKVSGYVTDAENGYISVGHRFGDFLPYILYGKNGIVDHEDRPVYPDVSFNTPELALNDTVIDPDSGATIGQLYGSAMVASGQIVAGLNGAMKFLQPQQSNWTFGCRWDIATGVAIKGEYQRISKFNDSNGFFFNESGFVDAVSSESVYQFSLDAVF
jgi:hypothetical protein